MCGIEQHAWIATPTRDDAGYERHGDPINFTWNTSTNGLFIYSNCSFTAGENIDIEIEHHRDECGTLCARRPNCDMFSWWGDHCRLKSNSTHQVIALGHGNGICGYPNRNVNLSDVNGQAV